MTISVVFDPPLRADSPAVFNSKAFTLVGDLNTFSTQANSTASDINAQVTDPGVVAIGDDLIGANTIGAVAAIKADVSAVAAIKADVSAVAAIKADVSAVAANEANINAAVADLPALAAKVSKTGDTMTGPLSVPAGATGAQVPQAQEIAGLVRAMAVGTVSQSGGVPTGAIIEKGSNANGRYVRFADGTQMCLRDVALGTTSNATGSLFSTNTVSGSWAANFSTTPTVVTSAKDSQGALVWTSNVAANTTGFSLLQGMSVINSASANANLVAVGRWF